MAGTEKNSPPLNNSRSITPPPTHPTKPPSVKDERQRAHERTRSSQEHDEAVGSVSPKNPFHHAQNKR